MDKFKLDEEIKIKELKKEEFLETNGKKNKLKITAISIFSLSLVILICACLLVSLQLFQNYRIPSISQIAPSINTPVITIPTETPDIEPGNPFDLAVTSLSTQLTPDVVTTISFDINRMTSVENDLCSGHFEIINMTQLQKVHEETYSQETDSKVTGLWVGLVAFDGKENDHRLGNVVPLYDGQVGQTAFHLANEPGFRRVANRFTDGVNDWFVFNTEFMNSSGHKSGGSSQGISEGSFFENGTDLKGHSITMIRRDISKLVIQPDYYALDVTWSFWEPKEPNENDWLTITPTSGMLNTGENQVILVEFSSKSLQTGIYSTELLVDYGENCSPPAIIPVTLHVIDE